MPVPGEVAGEEFLAGGASRDRVVRTLSRNGLIAYPTETFYGLGANATSDAAVGRLFEAKGRPGNAPLSVIIPDSQALATLVKDVPDSARRLMAAFWPGALTLVFRAAGHLPDRLTAGTGTVGVRVPGHPVAAAISKACAFPVTATSANRSGEAPACAPEDLSPAIREAIDLVVDGGRTPGGSPSTVLDVTVDPPRILRPGRISWAEIEAVLNPPG